MLHRKINRRAQIGETLTWIVVSAIIVVILILFIYISYALSKAKDVEKFTQSIKLGDKEVKVDLVGEKTDLALERNNQNEAIIKRWIEDES